MYDRHLPNPKPLLKQNKLRGRLNDLIGITGYRMARYRQSWKEVVFAPLNVVWRPHLLSILLFEVCSIDYLAGVPDNLLINVFSRVSYLGLESVSTLA